MSKDIDAIQFRNEDGDYVYAKTHLDAIDGMEGYTEGLTQITQLLGDYISDSGWKEYDYNAGNEVRINEVYKNDGFQCGIREIRFNPTKFGNKNFITIKLFRINVRNFSNSLQLFQLPTGFIKESIRFSMIGDGNLHPYILEANTRGEVKVYISPEDRDKSNNSHWIYGQYTWIE